MPEHPSAAIIPPTSAPERPPAEPAPASVQELLRQQETLRAVIESISSELELRPLLTRIVRHACELIGADRGTIGLIDEVRGVVRTEAVFNMPADEMGAEMPPGVGLAGEVLRRREPVVLERYGDVPHPTQPGMLDDAVIGVPICWRHRVIGFFGIGLSPQRADGNAGQRPRHFRERDVQTLALFARHAAIAIENARRYEWEQRRTERLKLIARIGHIITADLRLEDLLQHAADAIHELLGYPNIAIPLILPEDPETLVLNTVGGHYKEIVRGEYRLPTSAGIMGAAVRSREVVLVNDVMADARYVPTPGATGITSELAVPILLAERVLGVINVEGGGPFSEEDAASLQIIADQLAVAIENARLFERSQQLAIVEERQRLARELHDSVTQLLFSITLIGQSVAAAWRRDSGEGERRVARLLELSRAALAEMRALLAELRPTGPAASPLPAGGPLPGIMQVRRDGLAAALGAHLAERAYDGLHIRLDTSGYHPQPLAREEALYRIVQEALNNVVKHAGAHTVQIRLHSDQWGTRLSVEDDGIGFQRAGGEALPAIGGGFASGLGLLTMRERAEALGGTLHIESAPGRGTAITVTIPAGKEGTP